MTFYCLCVAHGKRRYFIYYLNLDINFYKEGSFSRLSQEVTIAVVSSVSVFVVASTVFFTFGFLSGYVCHKKRKVDGTVPLDQKTQSSPYYDDVVLKQEKELELKENTAYGLMQ